MKKKITIKRINDDVDNREYQTPIVIIKRIKVEHGFAGSGDHRPGHGWGDENHPHDGPGNGNGHPFGRW